MQTILANGSTYLVQRTAINNNFTELYTLVAAAATASALTAEAATARAAEAAAQATANAAIPSAQKAVALGVATLDASVKIPAAQIPNPTATTLGGVQSIAPVSHQFVTGISTSGVPSLAQPVAGDIGGLAASATTDTTNAANIASGILPNARLAIDATPTSSSTNTVQSGGVFTALAAKANTASLAASATTDTTNAANIGSGTLPTGRLPALTGDVTTSAGSAATTISAAAPALSQQSTNAQSGTTYTLVLSDAGQNVDMNNAAANTLTIPPNSSVAFPVGTVITVTNAGAGVTTIAAGSGVTAVKPTARSLSISAQYETAQLYKVATDTWRVLCG